MRSAKRPVKRKGKVADEIASEYADTDSRDDTEVSESKSP